MSLYLEVNNETAKVNKSTQSLQLHTRIPLLKSVISTGYSSANSQGKWIGKYKD